MVVLLGVSPVVSAEVEDDADIQEEIRVETEDREPHYSHKFDAATMLTHFEDITSVFNQTFQNLFATICWDNTEVD